MPITDYEDESDRIKRMFAEAVALRKDTDTPRGSMVGNIYVPPSWTEQLAPAVNNVMAGYKTSKADEMSRAQGQRSQDEYANWMKMRPRGTVQEESTSEEIPGTVAPGPQMDKAFPEQGNFRGPMQDDVQGAPPGPLLKTRMNTTRTKVEPTTDQNIDWAAQGMKNPLSKALASAFMEDAIVKAPEREAARVFKADEAEKQRQGKMDQLRATHTAKLEQYELLSRDKKLDRNQLLYVEEMKNRTKLALGELDAHARVDAANARAAAAGKKNTPVPNNVIKAMSEAEQASDGINTAYATFKPEYAGYLGGAAATWAKVAPDWLSTDSAKEAAAWWQTYNDQAALVRRHSLFGSAFTGTEQKAWDAATISKTTPPELIAKYIQERAVLSAKFYNKLRNQYTTSGYGAVADAFPERSEAFGSVGNDETPATVLAPQRDIPVPQRRATDIKPPAASTLPPGVTRVPGT